MNLSPRLQWSHAIEHRLALGLYPIRHSSLLLFASLQMACIGQQHDKYIGTIDTGEIDVQDTDVVNNPPTIEILAPTEGSHYYTNQPVQLHLQVSDGEDAATDLRIRVLSSIDGELGRWTPTGDGQDETLEFELSSGEHQITAEVTDTEDAQSTAMISITAAGVNSSPTCQIVSPVEGAIFGNGQSILLQAEVGDAEDSLEALAVLWNAAYSVVGESTVNADGLVDTEMEIVVADLLGSGEGEMQTFSLEVQDTVGASCITSVSVYVGYPPVLTVQEPLDGSVVTHGDIVNLWAHVADHGPQWVPQESMIRWASDIDGLLYEGSTQNEGNSLHSLNSLSPGLHTLTVTATDEEGIAVQEQIALRVNRIPSIQSASLSPNPVYTNDTLVANVMVSDPDGDPVSATYTWYENDVLTSFTGGSISPTDLQFEDVWRVVITPTDGYIEGPSQELSIVVSNTLPTISGVSLSPSTGVYNDQLLTCSGTAYDPDQTVLPVYAWDVGGMLYPSSALNLATIDAWPGQTVTCTVSATDDTGASVFDTASVLIENRNPQLSQIAIDVANPSTNDSVTCTALYSDDDGETLAVDWAWQVGGTTLSTSPTLDLSSVSINPNDLLTCLVSVSDGLGASAASSSAVTVVNTPPVVNTVNVSPAAPTMYDTLTCSSNVSDVDGETLTTTVQFQSQGTTFYSQSGTSASVLPSNYGLGSGSTVTCLVTTTDGYGGSDQLTDTVTLDSSAPALSGLSITPASIYTGTSASCSGTAIDPNDGNLTSSIQYTWKVNGTTVGLGPTYTVLATQTNVGDALVCEATVTDSHGESDTATTLKLVQNTVPVINSVSISPSTLYNDQTVTCQVNATDPDDAPTLTYTWTESAATIGSGMTLDLDTTAVLPGDSVLCTVVASDASGASDTDSASQTIANRAPNTPVATITWSNNGGTSGTPIAGSILNCAGNGTDPDGQSLNYTYAWQSSTGSTVSGATVGSSQVQGGETWTCTVTASDGQLSTSGSAMVNVLEPCAPDTDYENLDLGGFTSAELVRVCAGTEGLGRYTISKDILFMTTEVSQGMFADLMGYDSIDYGTPYGAGSNHPAYYVSWHMAADFANQMTTRHNAVEGTTLTACYTCSGSKTESVSCTYASTTSGTCSGYRLPTEAEWEYAARAGGDQEFWTPDGGGNVASNLCNSVSPIQDGVGSPALDTYTWYCYNRYSANYYNIDKPVGLKSSNGFGLHDMHGNLAEWTADRWGCTYPITNTDPFCTTSATSYTIRGGDWTNNASLIRSSYRSSLDGNSRTYKQGFRVVRDL